VLGGWDIGVYMYVLGGWESGVSNPITPARIHAPTHAHTHICGEEGPGKADGAGCCVRAPPICVRAPPICVRAPPICVRALQSNPHMVRPFMIAGGDTRDGAMLKLDMESDMERMRVSSLRKTPEGRYGCCG